MKYKQMLDQNMVPEWRNQYLDYKGLDAALSKAIDNKLMKSREKGVDSYFELIKFNQKFANYFSRECLAQLEKINSFHREKLSEMKGKYNNLQDQLEQVLSSAIYKQIQPDDKRFSPSLSSSNHENLLINHHNHNHPQNHLNHQQEQEDSSVHSSIVFISDLFRSLKCRMTNSSLRPELSTTCGLADTIGQLDLNFDRARKLSATSMTSLRASKEKVSSLAKKLSEGITQTVHKLSDNLCTPVDPDHHQFPVKVNGGRPRSRASSTCEPPPVASDQGETPDHSHNLLSSPVVDHHAQSNAPLPSLAGAKPPQSKKKIIASYRKKMSYLKFSFRELYFNLVLFEQYTQLNYTGFEQILRKHDRMFASTLGRKFYQEHVQTAEFYNHLPIIDHLIEGVEHIYTLHFENGNRQKAIKKLKVPSNVYQRSSPMLDFRVGYELGMFAVLFVLVLFVGFFNVTGYDWRTVFRLYRSPLLLIIFMFQAGISIVIWKHYKINHVLIFELNPRNNLSFHHFLEFGSILGIIWSLSLLMFLFSSRLKISPSVCPLVVVVLIGGYLLNPTATCHHQSRFWLLKILGRIFTAPFHPVRFADFWIADQLVSIVPLFLDLEYLSCFYTTGEVLSVSHLSVDFASRCVTRNPQDLVIRTIVAALPAWFRCAQCLRRWRDENWLPLHLANAGKYWCMVSVVILSSISQYNKSSFDFDTMRIIWMIAALFTSSLTAYWDIIYDFGLFNTYDSTSDEDKASTCGYMTSPKDSVISNGSQNEFFIRTDRRKKKKRYPFLRNELVYPVWVYYFAIVENWILRFGWIITMSLTEFSNIEAGLVVSLLAPLEMFRRFVWNCIRLENEQLNNCGLFRAVRDIPIEVVAPIDESHLDKVIMMMDSRDGPSMRNRLMKRRTLRPDRVSFIVIHPPDDSSTSVTKRSNIRM